MNSSFLPAERALTDPATPITYDAVCKAVDAVASDVADDSAVTSLLRQSLPTKAGMKKRKDGRAAIRLQQFAYLVGQYAVTALTVNAYVDALWGLATSLQRAKDPEAYARHHYEQLRHYLATSGEYEPQASNPMTRIAGRGEFRAKQRLYRLLHQRYGPKE